MTRFSTADAATAPLHCAVHFGALEDGSVPGLTNGDGLSDPTALTDVSGVMPAAFIPAVVTDGQLVPAHDVAKQTGLLLPLPASPSCRVTANFGRTAGSTPPVDDSLANGVLCSVGFFAFDGAHTTATVRVLPVAGVLTVRYSIDATPPHSPNPVTLAAADFPASDLRLGASAGSFYAGTVSLIHDGDGNYALTRAGEVLLTTTHRENFGARWDAAALIAFVGDPDTDYRLPVRWLAVSHPDTPVGTLGPARQLGAGTPATPGVLDITVLTAADDGTAVTQNSASVLRLGTYDVRLPDPTDVPAAGYFTVDLLMEPQTVFAEEGDDPWPTFTGPGVTVKDHAGSALVTASEWDTIVRPGDAVRLLATGDDVYHILYAGPSNANAGTIPNQFGTLEVGTGYSVAGAYYLSDGGMILLDATDGDVGVYLPSLTADARDQHRRPFTFKRIDHSAHTVTLQDQGDTYGFNGLAGPYLMAPGETVAVTGDHAAGSHWPMTGYRPHKLVRTFTAGATLSPWDEIVIMNSSDPVGVNFAAVVVGQVLTITNAGAGAVTLATSIAGVSDPTLATGESITVTLGPVDFVKLSSIPA